MRITYGDGTTEYGPGVSIELTGEEVARAISAYLTAYDVNIQGARTITVNGDLCEAGEVYVDPGAFVVANGKRYVAPRPPRRRRLTPSTPTGETE